MLRILVKSVKSLTFQEISILLYFTLFDLTMKSGIEKQSTLWKKMN